jgi:hypothetical protein
LLFFKKYPIILSMRLRFLASVIIAIFAIFFSTAVAQASEGTIELQTVDDSDAQCFAMSTIIGRSNDFQVQIKCQNLIYPVGDQASYYILWANPVREENDNDDATIPPVRLGDLEFGRESFRAREAFASLFVTRETSRSPRNPSTERVMEGEVQPIAFLETEPDEDEEPEITPEPTPQATPTPQPQGGGIVSTIISIFTTIIVIIIILAIIIFIIYKIRNRNE